MRARTDILEKEQQIREWINENYQIHKLLKLNCKVETLKSYYKKMNIIYAGNQGSKDIKVASNKKSALEFLLSNISNSKKRVSVLQKKE